MAKTKKFSAADELMFNLNLNETEKNKKKPTDEPKIKQVSEETKKAARISQSSDSVSRNKQKERPSNPGGRPRRYMDLSDKVIKDGKVNQEETYYSALVKFPKGIEETMKILAIKEKYKGGVTEYVNHVVMEDLRRRGML